MNFSILPPLTPLTRVTPFLGGGVGGWEAKLLRVLRPLCVDLDLGPQTFYLVYGHPKPWRGSQAQTPGTPSRPPPPPPWALAVEDLAVFQLERLFSGT